MRGASAVLLSVMVTPGLVGSAPAPAQDAGRARLRAESMGGHLAAGNVGRIAFGTRRDGNDEIYVMNDDGSGAARLTTHIQTDNNPEWSPAAGKILFTSHRDGNEDVYVMDAPSGTSPQNLTVDCDSRDTEATWSPDGTRIAFASGREGDQEIWVMNADGSVPTQLTDLPGSAESKPDWSPDGTKIAYITGRDGNEEVYVINVDGTGNTRLTNTAAAEGDLDWSPDGTKIVYFRQETGDGQVDIWLMNANGSGQTKLTNTPGREQNPCWSPDGTRVAFSEPGPNSRELYAIPVTGGSPEQLTDNDAYDDWPSWVEVPNRPPTAPTSVAVSPSSPKTADNLTASASGSVDADGHHLIYEFQWVRSTDGGASWGSWGLDGGSLPSAHTSKQEMWQARARADDGTNYSAWMHSVPATIGNTAPTQPTVDVTPDSPTTDDDLSVSATGSTDPDGDTVSYSCRWHRDDAHQSAYDDATSVPSSATSKNEVWKCVVTPTDGTDDGPTDEDSVTLGNTAPTLTWRGTTGYETDGVDPEEGEYPLDRFTFRVVYTDADGGLPTHCRLVLEREGSPRVFNMRRGSGNTATGRQFLFRRCLAPGNYRYRIEAHDGDEPATGSPTEWLDGPHVSPRQNGRPDGLLWDDGRWLGDNIYDNTGAGQKTRRMVEAGKGVSFRVRIYNDASEERRVRIEGPGSNSRWTLGYETAAGSDVTHKITDGGWRPTLRGGGSTEIIITATAAAATAPGTKKTIYLRAGFNDWNATKFADKADTIRIDTTVAGDAPAGGCRITSLSTAPTATGAQLTFALSAPASVQATIRNIAGRPVKTLCTARDCEAGTNTLLWNATSDQGTTVPNGMYLVEVGARADGGGQTRALTQVRIGR